MCGQVQTFFERADVAVAPNENFGRTFGANWADLKTVQWQIIRNVASAPILQKVTGGGDVCAGLWTKAIGQAVGFKNPPSQSQCPERGYGHGA